MNALTPIRRVNRGRHIQDRHKGAARMLGYALASDCADTWQDFATVMTKRLTLRERGAVTLMMAETLPDDELRTILYVGQRGAGLPPAPFDNALQDAALWAGAATDDELRAYALTAFRALNMADRQDFIAHVSNGGGDEQVC
ncbi:hypothetical protein [uncultured Jannaschia sp.]|uniref:hypothetical protein n=1 Tax=uncultured Jannaschia sp. TaxID=293347 RepID=UPI00261100D9|nr:hypothetical protein [uncultured Jannaschia sp.]